MPYCRVGLQGAVATKAVVTLAATAEVAAAIKGIAGFCVGGALVFPSQVAL